MTHWIFIKKCTILLILLFLLDWLISISLLRGLNKNYGFEKQPEILINGSSMSLSGFNKTEIEKSTGKEIAAYSYEGVSVSDRLAMIDHFFHMYPKDIQTVIYEINPILLSNISSSENVYALFYPYMDDPSIDQFIRDRAPFKDYYIHKIVRTSRFDARLINKVVQGYLGKYENLKMNVLDTTALLPLLAKKGTAEMPLEPLNVIVFKKTMDLIRTHNAEVILVMMPMYYMKLNTYPSEEYNNLCNYLENYADSLEGISFLDLNQDSIIHCAGYFADPLHFNVYGQQNITEIICSRLK